MKKIIFNIIRAIAFIFFSAIAPILIINYKFKLFSATDKKFTGWGLIVILIVFLATNYILKMLVDIINSPYAKQLVSGIRKVLLPLLILILIVGSIDKYSKEVMYVLRGITISELIAILVNPFPYLARKSKDKHLKDVIASAIK